MSVILDTSAFYFPRALQRLVLRPEAVVVPAMAFAERARQLQRDRGIDPMDFLDGLMRRGFAVEPLGARQAARYAPYVGDTAWRRLSADALIAGHVHEGDELWTRNVRDFVELGVPAAQIVDPSEA